MTSLTASDFPDFYREVHGHTPFPWQTTLVERILAEGCWPDVLDVPTGLGKTSVIDVAVFVASVRPDLAQRRLFFVVDRRLIIDEAYTHACRLASALSHPQSALIAQIAGALRQPDDEVPLQVTRMRGGLTWSWRWLERPDRYAVIVGTVDQVGSRLLFRGYGVGEHLRSIDAALVGVDSMIVIDEAHLSEPFRQTVDAIGRLDPGQGPRLLTMSATVSDSSEQRVHRISEADEAHETARLRLHADRRLHLLQPAASKKTSATVVPSVMSRWAQSLARPAGSGAVVAVICNTVTRARAVFDQLPPDVDRLLLIGRTRPIDSEYLLEESYERIRAGRTREPGRNLILVATQTIEVGANIDVDALVTESAALPALIQRLGRLDRLGLQGVTHALVVHDPSSGVDDPIYGASREATWKWLTSLTEPLSPKSDPSATTLTTGLTASPVALRTLLDRLPAEAKAALQPEQPYIPQLHADVLDAWVQTSPAPHSDPPVAPYLHGIGRGDPDVAVVWRSGLPEDLRLWESALHAIPPVAEESLEAPVAAVRRWLAEHGDHPVSDLEGEPARDQPISSDRLIAVRYLGPRRPPEPISAQDVHPGDMIVVRAEQGGCDAYGWNPHSTEPVTDLADFARRRGKPIIRLRAELRSVVRTHHPDLEPAIARLISLADDPNQTPTVPTVRRALPKPASCGLPFLDNLARLAERLRVNTYLANEDEAVVLLSSRGGSFQGDEGELDSSTRPSGPLGLTVHEQQVAARAASFSRGLQLPQPWKSAVIRASAWHDEGKRDPRFQAMLYQRPLRALGHAPLLAKSGMDPADRAAFRKARAMAGYPAGMRHEALSARIAAALCHDADDLTLHLIAAHHGRNRPLLPPVHDPAPQKLTITINGSSADLSTDHTVDLDAPHRFATLNAIHGRWNLAMLEAVVRLADIWCSEQDDPQET